MTPGGEPCGHLLGRLPCTNAQPHTGAGKGCTHEHGSWVGDRHQYGDDE